MIETEAFIQMTIDVCLRIRELGKPFFRIKGLVKGAFSCEEEAEYGATHGHLLKVSPALPRVII